MDDDLFVVDLHGGNGDQDGNVRDGSGFKSREQRLHDELFGASDGDSDSANVDQVDEPGELEAELSDSSEGSGSSDSEDDQSRSKESAGSRALKRKPAWVDEDDEQVQVNVSAVARLRKLRKSKDETIVSGTEYSKRLQSHLMARTTASWADMGKNEIGQDREGSDSSDSQSDIESDHDDGVSKALASSKVAKSKLLSKGTIEVQRLKDVNQQERSKVVLQSVRFHPSQPLLMTAGYDKTVRFFQVNSKSSEKIQSVILKDLPVGAAEYSPDGSKVYCTGKRKHWYCIDVAAGNVDKVPRILGREDNAINEFAVSPSGQILAMPGNNGVVTLVSTLTHAKIGQLKSEYSCRGVCFNRSGDSLLSVGGDGLVYVWDIRQQKLQGRFVDDGCVSGSSITMSSDDKYIAAASDSGVVNFYDSVSAFKDISLSNSFPPSPKPARRVMNLTTRISQVAFHPSSQLAFVASHAKKEALRLVHVPSFTVFSNWPTSNTPLHYVSSASFSSDGRMLAIGNDKGKALLYRIKHFWSSSA